MPRIPLAPFAVLAWTIVTAPPGAGAQVLSFERVHELPHALDIAQDLHGFLWVATQQGLARYDGYTATFFTANPADLTSLSHSKVHCVAVDSRGFVWAGTYGGGLNRYDPYTGAFEHFMREPGNPRSLSQDTVMVITEDRDGVIWVGTLNGLNRIEPNSRSVTRYFHDSSDPASLAGSEVRAIHVDRAGTVWVGTDVADQDDPTSGGLSRFDPVTGRFLRFRPNAARDASPMANDVRAIHEDSKGNLWIGTWSNDLYVRDRKTGGFNQIAYVEHPDWMRQPGTWGTEQFAGIKFIHEDAGGNVWIGVVFRGLHVYDPRSGSVTHHPRDKDDLTSAGYNLGDDGVWSIFESRDGVLWLGTWGGLYKRYRYQNKLARYRLDPEGAPGFNTTHAFLEDRSGALWIGTRSGGLVRYDLAKGTTSRYLHDPRDARGISSNYVWEIYEDSSGVLWIGTGAGLDRFDGEAFHSYRHNPVDASSLNWGAVSAIREDAEGRLWVGTDGGGLCRFDRSTARCTRYQHDPADSTTLSHNAVTSLLVDREGFLWVGTLGGGASRMAPGTDRFARYQPTTGDPHSLSDLYVTALYEDDTGTTWVGTKSGGLNRYDPGIGFSHFTTRDSELPDDHILAILGDGMGNLWISTRTQLTRFDPRTSAIRTYLQRFAWWSYRAAYVNKAGRFFFGSADGFYAFDPMDIQSDPDPPAVLLTGFKLARSSEGVTSATPVLESDREFRLGHRQNDFTFSFTGIHYGRPEHIRYAYRLDPFDRDWREAGTQRSATYVRVPPGRYTFRVRAANADGVWNEEGARVGMVILPPWWRTWWAYVIYVILVLITLLAADRLQRRRLYRKQESDAAIRVAELRAQAFEADNRRKQLELDKARELEAMNATLLAHEKQLEAQNRRLAEMDQLKSRFFANISHEFRTPLTLILGPVKDALADSKSLDLHHLSLIRRNGENLLRLISQLLDLSRLEAGAMQLSLRRGDVVAFVRRITTAFSSRAERAQVALTFESDQSTHVVAFDRSKLETICQNLLSNAFKFTPAGGAVVVAVAESAGFVEVSVSDTGVGIPQDVVPFIFDRFYQVDASATRQHEGAGIGLALVKELVELHGGVVAVRSKVGVGTTFSVRIPAEPAVGAQYEEEGEALPHRAHGDGAEEVVTVESEALPDKEDAASILIVEDNADVRAYLRSHLTASYCVIEAADGAEGLKRARLDRPDLVIADVMMPVMDGYALCKAIKGDPDLDHIPVVLVTARADEESKLEGLEQRADDYLTKPFSAAELLYRIENLIVLRRRLRARFSREVVLEPGHIVVTSEKAVFLDRIQKICEANLADASFGVERLAEAVNMSSRQLQRRLKEIEQLTPAGYIRLVRLQRAASMLEQGAGRVKEVAHATGFRDVKHFSTLFRQVFGVPPSDYECSVRSDGA